ncbi:MAG: uncharacterized protein JWO20_2616 [Candidatus Angelobacter sp.]|nr:uncharacterized protein [Candidatus Angelobacter sp.]
MKIEDLIKHYPNLYHMAETGTWEAIKRHGLLSTSALLDLFEIRGNQRRIIETERRPQSVPITHPKHGRAVIRDQKPMHETGLLKCLQDGITPSQWYEVLNKRVFFWLSKDRLERLLSARAYKGKQHCVLTLKTEELLSNHAKAVTLCPINSGATLYIPQPRGKDTFQRIEDYPFEAWVDKRGVENAVVELVVDYAVKDAERYVLKVDERMADHNIENVFTRQSQ